jgi:hypothetical protein
MVSGVESVATDNEFRQGDVISARLGGIGEPVGLTNDPCHVAILSQTCDVAQPSKEFCLVAPAEQLPDGQHKAVLKGRKPLMIPLDDDAGGRWAADAGRAFSITKSILGTAQLVARCAASDHGRQATRTRARIARAFGRFPFPDEVHPVFAQLEDRLRSKAGTSGNLGQVIDLIDDIRITADQWDKPGRHLKLYLVVVGSELIPAEDCDPAWTWNRVKGWTVKDTHGFTLDRVCELILANHHDGEDHRHDDLTSLWHLWREFGTALHSTLIKPHLDDEVTRVDVEVLSDDDMTLRVFKTTEALDLQALSDANLRG